jgi:hypothetical protein
MKTKNSFFRNINPLKSSREDYSRKSYYRSYLSKYQDGKFYLTLIEEIKSKAEIKTNIDVKLIKDKKLKEINLTDIVREFGEPLHKVICKDLLGIQILLFKQSLGGYKTKLEFHFLNDILFFYSYTFSNIKNEEKNDIIQIIKQKYLNERSYDIVNNYIVDKENNMILLNDNIRFSIYYFCDNKLDLEQIQEVIYLKKGGNQINQETTNDMNKEILYNIL